jgi:arylsulfatase A-like enzyme
MMRVVTLVWVTLALALAGCQRAPTVPARVLLISIDTLRSDHLGTYGYARPTSPNLDAFGRQGVVFEDVTTTSPWTLPAHASLFTGLYPTRHGVMDLTTTLSKDLPTLAARMAEAGFATGAVVNSRYLSPTFGLERGFQRFRYMTETRSQREPSKIITEQALAWARELTGKRWFLFVHYYDVHSDYTSLPEYEQQFVRPYSGLADGTTTQLLNGRSGEVSFDATDMQHVVDLYDAGIRQMDDEVARLLAGFGDDPELLVIIMSDHGEEFLEHGGLLHGRTQFQELVRVPLMLRGAGIPRGVRVTTLASLVDVMPTILAAVGAAPAPGIDGADLSSTWRGGGSDLGARYLSCEADHKNAEPDSIRAVRHHAYTLHADRVRRTTTLFDLGTDPGEQKDVAAAHPDVVADLRAQLDRFKTAKKATGGSVTLTPELEERLKSLGYAR